MPAKPLLEFWRERLLTGVGFDDVQEIAVDPRWPGVMAIWANKKPVLEQIHANTQSTAIFGVPRAHGTGAEPGDENAAT